MQILYLETHLLFKRASLLSLLITAIGASSPVLADEGDGQEDAVVVFLSPSSSNQDDRPLFEAIEAHLNALQAEFRVIEMLGKTPAEPREQLETAKKQAGLSDASAVIWLSADGTSVSLLAPELNSEPQLLRADNEETFSLTWCESIAAMVHSEVSALIPARPIPKPLPEVEEELPPIIEPPEEEPQRTLQVEINQRIAPREKNRRAFWIGATAGYSPMWVAVDELMLHGARIGTTVGFRDFVALDLTVGLFERFELTAGDELELSRWPLRLVVHGFYPLGKFQVGAGLGALLEITYLRGFEDELVDESASENQVVFGGSLFVSLRYWMYPWLGACLDGGLDVVKNSVLYTFEDETLLELRRVRTSISLGLAIRFDLGRVR